MLLIDVKMRLTLLCYIEIILGTAIRCYQCSSDMDSKDEDLCGAYTYFDKERNVPIECNSEESHMPGTFCVKYTEQSPRGFICKYIYLFAKMRYLVIQQNDNIVRKTATSVKSVFFRAYRIIQQKANRSFLDM